MNEFWTWIAWPLIRGLGPIAIAAVVIAIAGAILTQSSSVGLAFAVAVIIGAIVGIKIATTGR